MKKEAESEEKQRVSLLFLWGYDIIIISGDKAVFLGGFYVR